MTVKGTQRIGGATVTDPDRFFAQIVLAADYAKDPEVARGQLIHMVVSAIKEAKKSGSGGCARAIIGVSERIDSLV